MGVIRGDEMTFDDQESRYAINTLLFVYAVLLAVNIWPPAAIPVIAVWIRLRRD